MKKEIKKAKRKKKSEKKPKLLVKEPKQEEFIEPLAQNKKAIVPILESTGEVPAPAGGELEDFLSRVETPSIQGKEKKEKEPGQLYSSSQELYSGRREKEEPSGFSEERSVDDVVDRLKERKSFIETPTVFSVKNLFETKTIGGGPVHMPEIDAGPEDDYLRIYAKPHNKKETIPFVKKEGVDIKKYKKAK